MSTVRIRARIHKKRPSLLRPACCLAACVSVVAPAALADELPHSRVHPLTGDVETVESYDDGTGDLDVRHVRDDGANPPVSVDVAAGARDELGARIEIDASGRTLVLFWRDVDDGAVLLRRYDPAVDKWSVEYALSGAGGGSRPETADDGTDIWFVFEEPLPGATEIVVGVIDESPDPLSNVALDSTAWTGGDVDPRVHAEAGHVWVTWVDDTDDVGWSVRDAGTGAWSASAFEDSSADSVALARKRIRDSIVDP